jgi:hypothetical protein
MQISYYHNDLLSENSATVHSNFIFLKFFATLQLQFLVFTSLHPFYSTLPLLINQLQTSPFSSTETFKDPLQTSPLPAQAQPVYFHILTLFM